MRAGQIMFKGGSVFRGYWAITTKQHYLLCNSNMLHYWMLRCALACKALGGISEDIDYKKVVNFKTKGDTSNEQYT